jgi:hypothetical protein
MDTVDSASDCSDCASEGIKRDLFGDCGLCREYAGEHGLSKAGKDACLSGKEVRPDIASGLSDPDAPISHFEKVANGLYRSGTPNNQKDGVKVALEDLWGDQQVNAEHASHTTIIELRGYDKPPYYQSTEDDVHAEEKAAAALGINHERFPMETHDVQDPRYIQNVLDNIDSRIADGDRVLIHCYNGTDRTGVIAAAYQLTHDPALIELVKTDPDKATQYAWKSMANDGFVSKEMPELTQSVKDFVDWKHKQLTDGSADASKTPSIEVVQNAPAETDLLVPDIWQTSQVWKEMFNGAQKSIDLEQFYLNVNKPEESVTQIQ